MVTSALSKVLLGLTMAGAAAQMNSSCTSEKSVYVPELVAMRSGKNVTMSSFAGKVSLAINVASF